MSQPSSGASIYNQSKTSRRQSQGDEKHGGRQKNNQREGLTRDILHYGVKDLVLLSPALR
jgi:hypothetical protein